ncbi:MAG: hypothetical protein IPL61_19735 [Myxococcales bacterium]|nr:hypothetical protein [Myxococcales bacterium]
MSLHVCERCRGFVPTTSAECPHCRASARSGRRVLVGAIALGATLIAAACVPACAYGDFAPDPPVDAPAALDGGVPDGGGPDGGAPDAAVR